MGNGDDEASTRTDAGPVPVAVVRPVRRPTGWWVAPLYLAMGVVLTPWTLVLVNTLPDRAVSQNYRLAWVGFDVLLILSMTRTAWLAWRRSPYVVNVASATATLLVVDAWFDVTTAPTHALMQACALALFVELPAAVLSLLIAGRAQREIARTGALLPQWRVVQALRRRRPVEIPAVEGVPPARRRPRG